MILYIGNMYGRVCVTYRAPERWRKRRSETKKVIACLLVRSFDVLSGGLCLNAPPRNEEPDHALELKGLLKAKKVFRSVEMHAVYCGH
jgi:hypothetical protein